MPEKIKSIIEEELKKASRKYIFHYLVLGYQIYRNMSNLCVFLWSYKTQPQEDYQFPKYSETKILSKYMEELNVSEILNASIHEKPFLKTLFEKGCEHFVFTMIGMHYDKKGFDDVYSVFSNIIGMETYAQNLVHEDNSNFPSDPLTTSKENDTSPQFLHFIFANLDIELDSSYKSFSERYGINAILAHLATASRSQMGENFWEKLRVRVPFFTNQDVHNIRSQLIRCGHDLIMLQALFFCMKNKCFNSFLDLVIMNGIKFDRQGRQNLHEHLWKMLHIDDLELVLFDKLEIPISYKLTSKDKKEIASSFASAFCISNFSSDKKFLQEFSDVLSTFYFDLSKNTEIDYRYAVISYLSAFNVEVVTNNYEAGNGIFHAEISLGEEETVAFVCENESMRVAKKEVWHYAYEILITEVREFFSLDKPFTHAETMLFFIKRIESIEYLDFVSDFGILSADNFPEIGIDSCKVILCKAKSFISNSLLYRTFIEKIAKLNIDKFVCVDDKIYSYSSLLLSEFSTESLSSIEIEGSKIKDLYNKVVNPKAEFQKRIIDRDYKFVSIIDPLADEIAIYALDKNIASYHYFTSISEKVREYYLKLKEKEEINATAFDDGADIFSECTLDNTKVIILDSNRSVSLQLEELVSRIKLKYVAIACGYCFYSGLSLLKNIIDYTVYSGLPFDLYVGSLQGYSEANIGSVITGIDKQTVRKLNEFLAYNNFSLYTCNNRFYHGKLFLFEGDKETVICIGSSNISKSAFITNYELNIAFTTMTDSDFHAKIKKWLEQLRKYSVKLNYLEETMFAENELSQNNNAVINNISVLTMQKKINELANEEVRYRLRLWISYSPDIIAENLGILALPNYFAFVYNKRKLIVLESFEAGNSYFCISYKGSFEDVICNISSFSKTEIFAYSKMSKRGYHIQNRISMESNIRKFFDKGL